MNSVKKDWFDGRRFRRFFRLNAGFGIASALAHASAHTWGAAGGRSGRIFMRRFDPIFRGDKQKPSLQGLVYLLTMRVGRFCAIQASRPQVPFGVSPASAGSIAEDNRFVPRVVRPPHSATYLNPTSPAQLVGLIDNNTRQLMAMVVGVTMKWPKNQTYKDACAIVGNWLNEQKLVARL